MILHNGKEYYPLAWGHMERDEKVYYDRSAREKNYFYLDLNLNNDLSAKRVRETEGA